MPSAQTERIDVAERIDPITATTEVAGFLDGGSGPDDEADRLFGTFTLPAGGSRGSVLISSSLYAEHARNYRREVILARELAVRGIASLRYHYRGTGYSDGDPAAVAFPSMCEYAATALARLRERCPGVPNGFVGTRLGGLVAAATARSDATAPVLLWDAISSAGSFFQDAIKARKVGGMVADKQHGGGAASVEDPWAEGSLDSLGYRLPPGLRTTLEGVTLSGCLGAPGRPVLIVTVVPGYEAKPQAEAAAEDLRSSGWEVELRRIEGRLSWWTSRDSWDPDEDHPATREVIARSADWLERRLTRGSVS